MLLALYELLQTLLQVCYVTFTFIQGRYYYAPAPDSGGIKRSFCLPSRICLSVAYIWNNSRTERPRKTRIGTQVAHVTCDSDTTFRVKRSSSPGRFTHRDINVTARTYWAWELLLRCVCWAAREALGRPRRRRGAGHVSPRAQRVFIRYDTSKFYARKKDHGKDHSTSSSMQTKFEASVKQSVELSYYSVQYLAMQCVVGERS